MKNSKEYIINNMYLTKNKTVFGDDTSNTRGIEIIGRDLMKIDENNSLFVHMQPHDDSETPYAYHDFSIYSNQSFVASMKKVSDLELGLNKAELESRYGYVVMHNPQTNMVVESYNKHNTSEAKDFVIRYLSDTEELKPCKHPFEFPYENFTDFVCDLAVSSGLFKYSALEKNIDYHLEDVAIAYYNNLDKLKSVEVIEDLRAKYEKISYTPAILVGILHKKWVDSLPTVHDSHFASSIENYSGKPIKYNKKNMPNYSAEQLKILYMLKISYASLEFKQLADDAISNPEKVKENVEYIRSVHTSLVGYKLKLEANKTTETTSPHHQDNSGQEKSH